MDYNNALAVKNHNEILRCFAVVNANFSMRIINSLLEKINQQNEKIKMGALTVLRHLVNSGGSHMDDKKDLIISGLKGVLNDTNNKVKGVPFGECLLYPPEASGGYFGLAFATPPPPRVERFLALTL